jgi:hypothetical protein
MRSGPIVVRSRVNRLRDAREDPARLMLDL